MLITSLLPLLERYSLGFDLIAGAGNMVTLTIIPRKAAGAKHEPQSAEVRPIAITATAAEIDAELAKGDSGALGQLLAERKSLADQIAEQRATTEHAKTAAAKKAAPAKAGAKPDASAAPSAKTEADGLVAKAVPAPVDPQAPSATTPEPASLWD